jgi:hypothetical protein
MPSVGGTLNRLLRQPRATAIAVITATLVGAVSIGWMFWPPGPAKLGESSRLFERGVEASHNVSYLAATNLLTDAVKLNDNWPLAHARLAEAWYDLDNVDMASRTITAAHARAQKAKLAVERKANEETERIASYMRNLQQSFTRHVSTWGNWKTDEAQVRQNVRLENEILDLYFDGKGYLFTPTADLVILQKAAKLARHTNIYIIAYNAPDNIIPMVAQLNGVELCRISDMTKTSGYWSWIDFEIFIAQNPRI